jgi:hypothetical protein
MQEMFNNFFYKSFTIKQGSVCWLITHLIEYQFGKSEDVGGIGLDNLTIHLGVLFDWFANIDSDYIQRKFCLYYFQ